MHISSLLMHDHSHHFFCIVSDNALAVNADEAKSTKMKPRRANSTSIHRAPASHSFNRTRSAPNRLPKRRSHSHCEREEAMPTANSRWSSIPGHDNNGNSLGPSKSARRGLSKDSQVQLQKLASSRRPASVADPPVKPIRKFLEDEASFSSAESALSLPPYLRHDMSLAHCLAVTQTKRRTKGVRTIRRPLRGSDEERRNIVDILDAALGSLALDDAPATPIRAAT